jgi:hypothetical protein
MTRRGSLWPSSGRVSESHPSKQGFRRYDVLPERCGTRKTWEECGDA